MSAQIDLTASVSIGGGSDRKPGRYNARIVGVQITTEIQQADSAYGKKGERSPSWRPILAIDVDGTKEIFAPFASKRSMNEKSKSFRWLKEMNDFTDLQTQQFIDKHTTGAGFNFGSLLNDGGVACSVVFEEKDGKVIFTQFKAPQGGALQLAEASLALPDYIHKTTNDAGEELRVIEAEAYLPYCLPF